MRTLREFGFGELNVAEQYLAEELLYFTEYFERLRSEAEKNTLKINGLLKLPQLNVTWRMLMGSRFDYGDEKLLKLKELVEKAAETTIGLHPFLAFPWVRHVPGVPFPLDPMNTAGAEIQEYFGVIIITTCTTIVAFKASSVFETCV